jgi:hypothetical protein
MWAIVEKDNAAKALDKLPLQVAEKYAFWCAIIRQSGPGGLRAIKGFHDEKLSGRLAHLRSSRLSRQWRVLYRIQESVATVYVEGVVPHNYRP